MTLSLAQLLEVMPRLPQKDAARYLPHLLLACEEAEIVTRLRMAAFLAQVAHESNQLCNWGEVWGPTPQQLKYEPPSPVARALGNSEEGDGFRFRGRGPLQLTGRYNYTLAGASLHLDLLALPELVATPEVGFRAAGWFWHREKRLNPLADAQRFDLVTRRINGGMTDFDKRERYYRKALAVLRRR